MLVIVSAVSNTYANGLHISEISTEGLELSGRACCSRGFDRILHSCPESTGKPQPCLAAGTAELGCLVTHANRAMSGDISSLWGKKFAVQDMLFEHAGSWAPSPQSTLGSMGTSQPASSFNLDKLILPLEDLFCGPALQMNLEFTSFFFFLFSFFEK